ncbi:MAG: C40 family peptidase [Bacteroides sp.]|nr:C40 family peptidase [Bacteroides sp.]MCM1379831.1 C40 family peptidase [Bacteroides sp.]MCM1446190.1 C40 family peptidase [Prevotella sp.]
MKHSSVILLIAATLLLASCSSKKAVAIKSNRPQPTVVPTTTPSTDKQVRELIRRARTWIGTPYVYGGHTRREGTDCSGMIMELFLDVYNLKMPRSCAMQRDFSQVVQFDDMQPGDLVFFTTDKNSSRINHVGLYIGDNRMIHASSSRGVMESGLGEKYWQNNYHSSGTVIRRTTAPKVSTPIISTPVLAPIIDQHVDSIYVTDPAIFD